MDGKNRASHLLSPTFPPPLSFAVSSPHPLLSLFFFYSTAKNCSYFKHFTSGEEAEVFEVKTQKGGCHLATTQTVKNNSCRGFQLSVRHTGEHI